MRRVAANSLWGRRLTGAKGSKIATPDAELPRDQVIHNQHLDDLRALELQKRKHRRLMKAGGA